MKRAAALVLAAIALFASSASGAHTSTQTGVVFVDTSLGYQQGAATGTGIVLARAGLVLTNNHVIRGATQISVVLPSTRREYAARVLGYSVSGDVALLQVKNAPGLATVAVGDSSRLAVGQHVTAVGNAGGTATLVVTHGTITGLNRTITITNEQGGTVRLSGLVETDASLHPGDSGGPLLDANERVIGIDTAASTGFSFGSSAHEGYAVPIAEAMSIAAQIRARRGSSDVHVGATAFLGVQVQPSPAGELVLGVIDGGPVAKAGIAVGDVITAVDGHMVTSQQALVVLLLSHHPGDRVTLQWIDRSNAGHKATVRLASGPPQ